MFDSVIPDRLINLEVERIFTQIQLPSSEAENAGVLEEEDYIVTDWILTNQLTNLPTILRANLVYSTSRTLATH